MVFYVNKTLSARVQIGLSAAATVRAHHQGVAEYKRGMIMERTQTGKAVARQDPSFRDGRPKKYSPEQIQLALELLEQGKTYRQVTQMTGISKSTVIRARK